MRARKKYDEVELDTNKVITPMLDMAFQLLMFFVFTYHPSDLEGQMDLSLPADNEKAAHRPEDQKLDASPDKDQNLELPSDLTVVVRTQQDGTNNGLISAVTVEDRSGPTSIDKIDAAGNDLAPLEEHLKRVRETAENKQSIKVQGDSKLKWDKIVKIMDACRKAGFENISFVPPPDLR
jgi:biopolymer transport protein ExbD